MTNWPDGTPRRGPSDMGSVGGVDADGSAQRHTDDTKVARQGFGWVPDSVVGKADRDGRGTNIGPSSPLWRKPAPAVYTTGMQGKGRKR